MAVVEANRIDGWAFDFDDTLAISSKLWFDAFGFLGQKIEAMNGVLAETVAKRARELNNEMYRTFGVHPSKYGAIAGTMASEYGVDLLEMQKLMKIAMTMIYCGVPELKPGVNELFDYLRSKNKKIVVATHSAPGRMKIISEKLGWKNVIPVVTQSTLGPKDERIWQLAARTIKIEPENMAGVGDSVQGDIVAAKKAGFGREILIKPTWHIMAEGELPKGVLVIDEIGQLASVLVNENMV